MSKICINIYYICVCVCHVDSYCKTFFHIWNVELLIFDHLIDDLVNPSRISWHWKSYLTIAGKPLHQIRLEIKLAVAHGESTDTTLQVQVQHGGTCHLLQWHVILIQRNDKAQQLLCVELNRWEWLEWYKLLYLYLIYVCLFILRKHMRIMSLYNSLRTLTYGMKHTRVCVCTWLHCPYVSRTAKKHGCPSLRGPWMMLRSRYFCPLASQATSYQGRKLHGTSGICWRGHLLGKKTPFLDFANRHQHATLPIRSLPFLRQRLRPWKKHVWKLRQPLG